MVYHKGQSWDLYSSAAILIIYLCIHHHILQNVICSRMTPHIKQQEKKHCANSEDATVCLDRISEWCYTSHMLINHVKTKSMVITIQQKHQHSDLPFRLSLDGQNIEIVTEHRLLGLTDDNKFRWQALIEHIRKSMTKTTTTVSSFSTAAYHQHRHQKNLLQRSNKTSHRLPISSAGWLWRRAL